MTQWYLHLNVAQQIDFWVAVGTILLALMTSVAVIVSLSQTRGERRRFEQGFAPILTFDHVTGNQFEWFYLTVHNIGTGPALQGKLRGTVRYPFGADSPAPSNGSVDSGLMESMDLAYDLPLLNPGNYWTFKMEEATNGQLRSVRRDKTEFRPIEITYCDRFKNEYRTSYEDVERERYEWLPPRRLR